MWLKKEGFKYLINDWWCSYEIRHTGSYVLTEKLKALKAQLRAWNKNSFGRVEVKEALKKVKEWDDLDVQRPLSVKEREQKMEGLKEFKRWALLEEISCWRQKSREIWLNEFDRNTRFFHKMANSHRRENQISKMRINEAWLTEEEELRQGVVEAFKTLLSDTGEWRASLDGLSFQRINEEEAARLELPYTEEEVFTTLNDLNGDKAPGPDGFTIAF